MQTGPPQRRQLLVEGVADQGVHEARAAAPTSTSPATTPASSASSSSSSPPASGAVQPQQQIDVDLTADHRRPGQPQRPRRRAAGEPQPKRLPYGHWAAAVRPPPARRRQTHPHQLAQEQRAAAGPVQQQTQGSRRSGRPQLVPHQADGRRPVQPGRVIRSGSGRRSRPAYPEVSPSSSLRKVADDQHGGWPGEQLTQDLQRSCRRDAGRPRDHHVRDRFSATPANTAWPPRSRSGGSCPDRSSLTIRPRPSPVGRRPPRSNDPGRPSRPGRRARPAACRLALPRFALHPDHGGPVGQRGGRRRASSAPGRRTRGVTGAPGWAVPGGVAPTRPGTGPTPVPGREIQAGITVSSSRSRGQDRPQSSTSAVRALAIRPGRHLGVPSWYRPRASRATACSRRGGDGRGPPRRARPRGSAQAYRPVGPDLHGP